MVHFFGRIDPLIELYGQRHRAKVLELKHAELLRKEAALQERLKEIWQNLAEVGLASHGFRRV